MRYLFTLLFAFIISFSSVAQTDAVKIEPVQATISINDENSLLWEISGNGLTSTSWLFGTIHLIGKGASFA